MSWEMPSECLIRLVDEPPPGAKDRSPCIRYVLRLLPKGERTEERHNYGIGKETVRLLEKTAQMLCEHYQLQRGEPYRKNETRVIQIQPRPKRPS